MGWCLINHVWCCNYQYGVLDDILEEVLFCSTVDSLIISHSQLPTI